MARVLFFTMYDHYCMGMRIMAAHLDQHGHESHMIFFREHTAKPIDFPKPDNFFYHAIVNSRLQGYSHDVDPWTEQEMDLFLAKAREIAPDMVCFSIRSYFEPLLGRVLPRVREALPDCVMVAGGFGPSYNPERYLEYCDYAVIGEGEDVLLQMADRLDSGRGGLENLDNTASLQNGKVRLNPVRKLKHSLDRYPLPKYNQPRTHHIKDNGLHDGEINLSIYYLMAGRGCLGSCSYCSSGIWRKLFPQGMEMRRNRSQDRVFEELARAKDQGFTVFNFLDPYFFLPPDQTREFFSRYKKEIDLPFVANLHPKQMVEHPDLLDLIQRAGLYAASIGLQSGCAEFAKIHYNRKTSRETILDYARMLDERNLEIAYNFLAGNPFETWDDLRRSAEIVPLLPFDLKRDKLIIFQLNNFPGTGLTRRIEQAGLKRVSEKKFLFQGLTYFLRAMLDDQGFELAWNNQQLRNDPALLQKALAKIEVRTKHHGKSPQANLELIMSHLPPAPTNNFRKVFPGEKLLKKFFPRTPFSKLF